jgi:hypothetical protein
MWNNFVGNSVASLNRQLLRINGLALLTAAVAALLGSRWLVNSYLGPLQVGETQLSAISDPTFTFRNYVAVDSEKTVPTGMSEVTTSTRNGQAESRYTSAEFVAIRAGSRLIIVKARPYDRGTHFVGTLATLPEDLKTQIFKGVEPDITKAFLPLMIDASEDYTEGLVLAAIGVAVVVMITGWNLMKWKLRSQNPAKHPLCKALSRYGPLEIIVPEVDAEVSTGWNHVGNSAIQSKSWIIQNTLASAKVMRRDEIIWVYKKRTKQSVNFIPTGTTYAAIISDRRGGVIEASGSEQQVDDFIVGTVYEMPWIVAGYEKQLETLFKDRREEFSKVVNERRQETARAAASSPS